MKKVFALSFVILMNFALFAEPSSKKFNMNLATDMGVFNGVEKEYVFMQMTDGTYEKLSELDWELYGIPLLQAKTNISYNNFFTNIKGFVGIPKNCGFMHDYDWLNINYFSSGNVSYCPNKYKNIISNYSWSNNQVNILTGFDFDLGYGFIITKNQIISPFIGLQLNYFNLEAIDDHEYYASLKYDTEESSYYYDSYTTLSDETNFISGNVSTLSRYSYYSWLGTYYSYSSKIFSFTTIVAFSPVSYYDTLEHHILRNEYFADIVFGFFSAFKSTIDFSVNFNKHHSVYFNAQGMFSLVSQGKVYEGSSLSAGLSLTDPKGSGASSWNVTTSLGYKFTF